MHESYRLSFSVCSISQTPYQHSHHAFTASAPLSVPLVNSHLTLSEIGCIWCSCNVKVVFDKSLKKIYVLSDTNGFLEILYQSVLH